MLQEIKIKLNDLLLDPNNPRFISDLTEPIKVGDDQLEQKQKETLLRFSRKPTDDSEFEVTNIRDLYDSMLRIGYVGIDQIVIRPVAGSDKFLVLEGNRRVATIKTILLDYDNKIQPLDPSTRIEIDNHMTTFTEITAMLLDTQGLSQDQIDHKISILLGIRHHGSLLSWEPLPRAFNIYMEYMEEQPKENEFKFVNNKARAVANRLCIQTGDVTAALRTYVAYLQLRDRFPAVKDDHFSLIESGVKNRHLNAGYLKIDQSTFALDEESLAKLNMICQFATRDSKNPDVTTNGKKKIFKNPKEFKLLATLVDKMHRAAHTAIKSYAGDLIGRVENEDDLEMTLDQAVDALTAFENRMEWANAVGKLLDKQTEEISLDAYAGEGADRGQKDDLKATMIPLRRIMNL